MAGRAAAPGAGERSIVWRRISLVWGGELSVIVLGEDVKRLRSWMCVLCGSRLLGIVLLASFFFCHLGGELDSAYMTHQKVCKK